MKSTTHIETEYTPHGKTSSGTWRPVTMQRFRSQKSAERFLEEYKQHRAAFPKCYESFGISEEYKIMKRTVITIMSEWEDAQEVPLTLDELAQMEGEPVWVQSPGVPEYGRWAIVEGVSTADGDKILFLHDDFTCHEYGDVWLAYRHKQNAAPQN